MSSVKTQPAEAFGKSVNGKLMLTNTNVPDCRATQTTPRYDLLKDSNEPLALDIEFQEYRPKHAEKWAHRIGRIAIVNTSGQTIYDVYARYHQEANVDMKVPPKRLGFGVEWKDLKISNGAKWHEEVEENLKKIMHGRTIIGHGMRLDIAALTRDVWETVDNVVDTQNMYGQVKLSILAGNFLTDSFDFHDPCEDARATMGLYLRLHPYKGRVDAKEASFTINDDDFPALGAATKKKR